jgi:hypothetical protein
VLQDSLQKKLGVVNTGKRFCGVNDIAEIQCLFNGKHNKALLQSI